MHKRQPNGWKTSFRVLRAHTAQPLTKQIRAREATTKKRQQIFKVFRQAAQQVNATHSFAYYMLYAIHTQSIWFRLIVALFGIHFEPKERGNFERTPVGFCGKPYAVCVCVWVCVALAEPVQSENQCHIFWLSLGPSACVALACVAMMP